MRYRLEVRLGPADVDRRVVIRWRRPAWDGDDEVADVLGVLEAADGSTFTVRKASGESVVIPRERALGGKTVPPAPARRRGRWKRLPGGEGTVTAVAENARCRQPGRYLRPRSRHSCRLRPRASGTACPAVSRRTPGTCQESASLAACDPGEATARPLQAAAGHCASSDASARRG